MKDPRFNKAIQDLKKLSMTAAEKRAIFDHIISAPQAAPAQPVKSPWTIYSFSSWIMSHRTYSTVIAAVLLVVLVGGGAASAAQGSLPGDPLYAFKVNVTEPLRVALAGSPAGRAEVHAALATNRLVEAETLAAEGKLDAPKEQQLAMLIDAHATALNDNLVEVEKQSPEEAEKISVGFQASAEAHVRTLRKISGASVVLATAPEVARTPSGVSENTPVSDNADISTSSEASVPAAGSVTALAPTSAPPAMSFSASSSATSSRSVSVTSNKPTLFLKVVRKAPPVTATSTATTTATTTETSKSEGDIERTIRVDLQKIIDRRDRGNRAKQSVEIQASTTASTTPATSRPSSKRGRPGRSQVSNTASVLDASSTVKGRQEATATSSPHQQTEQPKSGNNTENTAAASAAIETPAVNVSGSAVINSDDMFGHRGNKASGGILKGGF